MNDGLGTPRTSPPEYRMIYVPALNKFLESRVKVPYPIFAPSLFSVLRREIAQADIVHVHGFMFQSTLAALALARVNRPRLPIVLTEHAGHAPYENRLLDLTERVAIATLGRWSARRADVVVVHNRSARDEVGRIAPGTEMVWIDNGVDSEFFRPALPEERLRIREKLGWDETPRVLFASRRVPKKGLNVALEALRYAGGSFRLVVAGPHPAPELEHVEWLGPVPRDRMAELYRASDALIAPSVGEGPTLVMLEALASGLPMVITDDPVARARLGEAGTAVRLRPPESRTMSAALVELLSDRSGPTSQQAASFARRNFSLEAWVDAYASLFARLLDRSPSSPISATPKSEGDDRMQTPIPR